MKRKFTKKKKTERKPDQIQSKIGCLFPYNRIEGKIGENFDKLFDPRIDLLLDSGAFTAYRCGKPIVLEEYMDFLKSYKKKLFGYFALDVIGNKEKTIRNLKIMRKNGFNPWPVFTVGNTKKDMDFMFEGSDVVGIGGIQSAIWPYSPELRISYIKKIMEWADGRKVHLLGIADEKILRTFKPFSCDSSSWMHSAQYGRMGIYIGNGVWKYAYHDTLTSGKIDDETLKEIKRQISRAGFTMADLYDKRMWNNRVRTVLSGQSVSVHMTARSWIKYVLEFQERFKTKIFIVIGAGGETEGTSQIHLQLDDLLGGTKYSMKRKLSESELEEMFEEGTAPKKRTWHLRKKQVIGTKKKRVFRKGKKK